MIGILLLVVVALLIVGALPTWKHSKEWGSIPTIVLTVVLVALLIMVLQGRI